MVQVCKIHWLSKEALEAEVTLSDGIFSLLCFAQPCYLQLGDKFMDVVHAFEPTPLRLLASTCCKVEKLSDNFSYYIEGKMEDTSSGIVRVGEISINVEYSCIPGDLKNDDYVSFGCSRLDIF